MQSYYLSFTLYDQKCFCFFLLLLMPCQYPLSEFIHLWILRDINLLNHLDASNLRVEPHTAPLAVSDPIVHDQLRPIGERQHVLPDAAHIVDGLLFSEPQGQKLKLIGLLCAVEPDELHTLPCCERVVYGLLTHCLHSADVVDGRLEFANLKHLVVAEP